MYKIAGFLIAALVTVAACGVDSDRAAISVDSERIVGDAPTIPTDPELQEDVDDEIEEDTDQAPQQSGSTPRTTTPPTTEGASRGDATESTADAGATTLNDPYVGDFGNGGYDVESYDLEIEWDPDSTRLDGAATIVAIATQELSAFNLELTGFDVSSVEIDGEPATFVRDDDELMIVPRSEPIPNGETFTTVIAYAGTPVDNEFIAGEVGRPSGWHTRDGFVFVAGEPLSASTFHPANDHPSDKASFTYRITAPSDLTVAANGTLEDTTTVTDERGRQPHDLDVRAARPAGHLPHDTRHRRLHRHRRRHQRQRCAGAQRDRHRTRRRTRTDLRCAARDDRRIRGAVRAVPVRGVRVGRGERLVRRSARDADVVDLRYRRRRFR